ncbi:transcription factor bHLH53-like [Olea europaea var. sylvestris]|uniref:transcription factor bHLH53-like n=1 Tax=Olea europaea var. sylvestris TaxID=158386 RepID=UPI000C1D7D3D|nr:transcription factor bHLH53-like [Olea europaea var. sylvestris]
MTGIIQMNMAQLSVFVVSFFFSSRSNYILHVCTEEYIYIQQDFNNCSFSQTQIELTPELLDFNNDFVLTDTRTDLFEPPDPLDTLKHEPFLLQEFESYHCSKCQKPYYFQDYYSEYEHTGLSCGYIPNPSMLQDFSSPEVMVTSLIHDFLTAPPVDSGESSKSIGKRPIDGSLSAQSIAARQMRRKITEKTQELGKHILGGRNVNTAEIFQAAYKYIKYLQA